jgi:hypothetical protein
VILLDENHVVEALAVILSAATANRVLLRAAQARKRLARIQDRAARSGDRIDIAAGFSGRGRKRLQEVQRGPLAREDGAGQPADLEYGLVGAQAIAVTGVPVQLNARIQLPERFLDPRATGENGRFPDDDAPVCALPGRNQLCGNVPASDVLAQRCGNLRFEIRRKRGLDS